MEAWQLDLDRHGVLRVPTPLWIGFALLARHWLLVLLVLVSARASKSTVQLIGDFDQLWPMLIVQVPVLLLALAGARRAPEAGRAARAVWGLGRPIVIVVALLNIGWTAHLLWQSDYWNLWPELFLGSCALIDLALAAHAWQSPAMAQLFREFPSAAAPAKAARS